MASFKFYSNLSDTEDEVILLLAITSILQLQFHEQAEIFFNTTKSINHLVDKFLWNKKPEMGIRNINADEMLFDLKNVPSHLLKSEFTSPEIEISKAFSIAEFIRKKEKISTGPKVKFSFVYTDEIKEWLSLLEATNALIANWYRERNQETELGFIDLSKGISQQIVKKASFDTDVFIISKVSPLTAQFIKLIRTLSPKAKMIIHAFESPSVYFANTYLYDMENFLYEEDLWLMNSERDRELSQLAWKKINSQVMPLKTPDVFMNSRVSGDRKNIFYFGRITEQKNLHEALMAVALIADKMRQEKRKFYIHGYEDFLGAPNLRIPSLGYLEFLYGLAKDLNILDLVEFHPAIPQSDILAKLKDGILLSTSIHSDENFGLIAFRALNAGIPVILTEWGGHVDFKSRFNHVNLISVYASNKSPHINPYELASSLLKIWKSPEPTKIASHKPEMDFSTLEPMNVMRPSALKVEMSQRLNDTFPWSPRKWPLYGQVFKSFDDESYQTAMKIYGAKNRPSVKPEETILNPLVKFSEKEITIHDPTTGLLRYPREGKNQNIPLNQLGNNEIRMVSLCDWEWLWENGFVYIRESYDV